MPSVGKFLKSYIDPEHMINSITWDLKQLLHLTPQENSDLIPGKPFEVRSVIRSNSSLLFLTKSKPKSKLQIQPYIFYRQGLLAYF